MAGALCLRKKNGFLYNKDLNPFMESDVLVQANP